jgi:transposase
MTRSAKGTLQRPGRGVRQKAGLNRAILASGWGRLVDRLEHKAPGRVQKVAAAYTSQRCSACGHVAAESRQSQTAFRCVACAWTGNADYNAARNIAAAGQVVAARGGQGSPGPGNREPPALGAVAERVGILVLPGQGGCQRNRSTAVVSSSSAAGRGSTPSPGPCGTARWPSRSTNGAVRSRW